MELAGNAFRILFESAPSLCLVLTPDLKICAASNAYLEATMTVRDQILGRGIFEVFPDNPEDNHATGVANLKASLQRVLTSRMPDSMPVQKYDVRNPATEGEQFEERYWSPINTPVLNEHGEVAYIIHRVEDVTEFVRIKQTAARAEEMEAEIFSRGKELAVTNERLRVANANFVHLYDKIVRLIAPEGFGADLAAGGANPAQGETRQVLTNEEMLLRVERLIADYQQLEEQYRHAQKMEAVGRLAGGMAHDFNNLLTVITGYASFLDQELADPGALSRVTQILGATERATKLTGKLLAFSRRQIAQLEVVDLNVAVRRLQGLLSPLIGEDVNLEISYGDHLGQIKVDLSQLELMIMNLVINSRDAMPGGGRIAIQTEPAQVEDGQVPGLAAGSYALLSVTDTGSGMPPEVLARIFEPFFTTKEPGKGTGLGLSTVRGIVEESGGAITVKSASGIGTEFLIYFPVTLDAASEDTTDLAEPSTPSRTGTVLVVEDDPELRELVVTVLENAGHRVLQAANGHEGLREFAEHASEIDLLLSDAIMPGMNGGELFQRLSLSRPGLPVLFMSGYDGHTLKDIPRASLNFIPKPFTPEALLRKIARTLYRTHISEANSSFGEINPPLGGGHYSA